MDDNKISAALSAELDEVDEIDASFRIFTVFVHLARDFPDTTSPEFETITRLRRSDDILNPKAYTKRLLGLEITKKGVEELAKEDWVVVIKLSAKRRFLT